MGIMTPGTVLLLDRTVMFRIILEPCRDIHYVLTFIPLVLSVVAAQAQIHWFHCKVLGNLGHMGIMTVQAGLVPLQRTVLDSDLA